MINVSYSPCPGLQAQIAKAKTMPAFQNADLFSLVKDLVNQSLFQDAIFVTQQMSTSSFPSISTSLVHISRGLLSSDLIWAEAIADMIEDELFRDSARLDICRQHLTNHNLGFAIRVAKKITYVGKDKLAWQEIDEYKENILPQIRERFSRLSVGKSSNGDNGDDMDIG